jgi:hypothetical protein
MELSNFVKHIFSIAIVLSSFGDSILLIIPEFIGENGLGGGARKTHLTIIRSPVGIQIIQ